MNNILFEENNKSNNKMFENNLLNESDDLSISSNEFNEIYCKKNNNPQSFFESSYSTSTVLNKKKKREEDKKIKLKKNAESAKKSREKKKLIFESLIKENLLLKNKISELKLKIHYCLCENCKKNFGIDKKVKLFVSEKVNSNTIINKINDNKKSIFFTTTIFIFICLFFIFNSFENNFIQNNLRNLSHSMNSKFSIEIEEIIKNKLLIKEIYLSCTEYYSIINSNKYFLNEKRKILFNNKYNMKVIDENFFYSNNFTSENCLDYVIQINNFNYSLSVDEKKHLQLIIVPSKKINNMKDFKNQNNLENNDNKNLEFYVLDCLVTGFRKNYAIPENIFNYN